MSLGLSKLLQMITDLIVPSRLDTSMRSVPASVQYSLPVTQSIANPAGLSKFSPITTLTEINERFDKRVSISEILSF